jgi:hypothetical protein
MNVADVLVLIVMACADVCLLVYLRRRRAHCIRMDRMTRSLQLHIRSEVAPDDVVAPRRRRLLQRVG